MRHHPPLRIAVLECDTPIGRTKEKYGGYGNLFKELLSNGAKLLQEKGEGEVELDITKYDVVNQEVYPELENVDAVLLTGSSMSGFFFFLITLVLLSGHMLQLLLLRKKKWIIYVVDEG